MNKSELKYLLFATVFALVVFGYLIPYVIDGNIGNLSPWVQFLVFNLGIFIFLQIFLKAASTGGRINIIGTIGVIALFMALDILMPPMMVNFDGTITNSVTLSASATDYMVGTLFTKMGLHGFMVYLATYVLAPIILLIIAAKLIPNFVKSL
jgi:hypothetical protein